MTPGAAEAIATLAAAMRAHGVRRCEVDGIALEIDLAWRPQAAAPEASAEPAETPAETPAESPALCRCGHDRDVAHGDNGCLFGCGAERCEDGAGTPVEA